MCSRKLTDLHPLIWNKAVSLKKSLENEGIELLIYCTYRSNAEQSELFKIGRTLPGRKVTWAEAGESKHNYMEAGKPAALAFDCVPMINGKPHWQTDTYGLKLWASISRKAKNLGLEWGGDWSAKKREFPHFQLNKEDINYVKKIT